MGKRGPQAKGYVEIRTTIPPELDEVINSLVAVSGGVSKATFVRQALLAGLAPYGLIRPEIAEALTAVSTHRGNTRNRERN